MLPATSRTTHTGTVYVDRTPPLTTASGVPDRTVGGTVVVKLAAADVGVGAGMGTTWYRINGVGPSRYLPSYTGIPVSETGTTTLTYWSKDVLGNTEATKTAVVRIDPAAPGKGGAEANAPCLSCHDAVAGKPNVPVKTDFSAGSVDYGLCRNCHWLGEHPAHARGTDCQGCHKTFPSRTDYVSGKTATAYGYFAGSDSPSLPVATIHAMHAAGSWPQTASADPRTCASCHTAAACDACHVGAVPHGQHAYASAPATYPMITYTVGRGTPEGDNSLDLSAAYTGTCAASWCHSKGEAKGPLDRTVYEESGAGVTRTGAWTLASSSGAYGGMVLYSQVTGSSLTYTLAGPGEIRLFGRCYPAGGIVSVSVDGGPAVDVDLYSVMSQNRTLLHSVRVGTGTHTLTATVTGRRNASATGAYVTLDAANIVVQHEPSGDFVPVCVGCHPTKDSAKGHGYNAIDHVGDDTATAEPVGGQPCGTCHEMDLMTEHAKPRATSKGKQCANCHPSPRKTLGVWGQTLLAGGLPRRGVRHRAARQHGRLAHGDDGLARRLHAQLPPRGHRPRAPLARPRRARPATATRATRRSSTRAGTTRAPPATATRTRRSRRTTTTASAATARPRPVCRRWARPRRTRTRRATIRRAMRPPRTVSRYRRASTRPVSSHPARSARRATTTPRSPTARRRTSARTAARWRASSARSCATAATHCPLAGASRRAAPVRCRTPGTAATSRRSSRGRAAIR